MRTLDIFLEDQLIGHLRDADGQSEFEYTADYLRGNARPISASLPLDPPIIRGAPARAYFGNLLPEGDVRSMLSRQHKVDTSDDIGFLSVLGADCAGALVILPSGSRPPVADAPFDKRYVAIEDDYELGQLIDVLKTSPTATFKGVPTRMSLAGAQSKTALAQFGTPRLYRSLGGATTHIIKFGGQLDQHGNEVFPGIVYNELFCSKLAAACKIEISSIELLPYRTFRDGPQDYVFCIERYDRIIHFNAHHGRPPNSVDRLPQEDFCQALGRFRGQKYEAHDGVSLQEMFAFCSDPEQIVAPAVARTELLKLVLFNFLIGNRDSHAKNYSLLRSGSKAYVAPAYDLVCTEIYEHVDRTLPQLIGGATTFEKVGEEQLDKFANEINIRPVNLRRDIRAMSSAILEGIDKVSKDIEQQPYASDALPTIKRVRDRIALNIGVIRELLDRPSDRLSGGPSM